LAAALSFWLSEERQLVASSLSESFSFESIGEENFKINSKKAQSEINPTK
jgi:hypothetical protein